MGRVGLVASAVLGISLLCGTAGWAETVRNTYGSASVTAEANALDVDVQLAAAYQDPGADPFDVEIVCVDTSGLFKWLFSLNAQGQAGLNLMGRWASASYYDIDAEEAAGVSFHVTLPPVLANPDDRLLISVRDSAVSAFGPIFSVSVPTYAGQPLRMSTLRVVLARDADGNLSLTATNLTHVPLVVPLASLTLGLAPTPDWIPDTTPDIRWTPNPPLSEAVLVLAPDETMSVVLPMPAIPAPSAAAYRAAMATLYAGIVDLYPGDYLAMGFPVAWGISWSYLPVVVP